VLPQRSWDGSTACAYNVSHKKIRKWRIREENRIVISLGIVRFIKVLVLKTQQYHIVDK
jgi:hypothetical protein